MKLTYQIIVLLIVLLFSLNLGSAQENALTEEYKQETIQRLSQLMNDLYVFPEVAKSTEKHLLNQLKEGHFKQFKSDESFANALTESVQYINKDKHMRIRVNRPYVAPPNSLERMIEEKVDQMNRSRSFNSGFNTVKVLEGNIGYLDLRGFAGLENGKDVADACMKLVSRVDAVIIDLTKNGGGSPRMVQYLCSYFFDQKLHLNSLYWREGDQTEEFWTLDEVGGIKMPEVPLFVLTSSRTFSGAEEFSYNMQTQKRAILVGQVTGGGANPGGTRRLNDNLSVFIPTGRAINPVTNTSWEGTGVVPDVETAIDESFDIAHQLAMEAANEFRALKKEKYSQLFLGLSRKLENYNSDNSKNDVLVELTKCIEAGFLNEGDINGLGYEYLLEYNKPKIAELIFKSNTKLFPNSSNVYDSYAESFMMKGDLKSALTNYQKAVELATINKDENLDLFKENLKNVEDKIKSKK